MRLFGSGLRGLGSKIFLGPTALNPAVGGSTLIKALTIGNIGGAAQESGYDPIAPIGSLTPAGATLRNNDGNPILQLAYSPGTGLLTLEVSNVVTQNYFTSITFGAPVSFSKTSASATFSGGIFWQWVMADPFFAFVGQTCTVTIA